MKLQHLFSSFDDLNIDWPPLEITQVTADTRDVQPGAVFVAVRGHQRDGHDHLSEAIARGALVLVVENKKNIPENFRGVVVQFKDSRRALDHLACAFHWNPGRELFCVGITGTNGKTTTSYIVESMLEARGFKTGVIGTIDHHLGAKVWSTDKTTPDPLSLQKRLREMKDSGAHAVVLEVTSHALEQKRADSVPFDAVVFTNLTLDHLDYHKTMKNYFQAKQKLFTERLEASTKVPTTAIVNSDDPWGRKLKVHSDCHLWTYGRRDADFRFEPLEMSLLSSRFRLISPFGDQVFEVPMGGLHNIYNSLAAVAVGVAAGATLPVMAAALKKFAGVPGRLQRIGNSKGLHVFVDFAHTPDALENSLRTLRTLKPSSGETPRFWVVFGCGGERDTEKRPLMAAIAEKWADVIVVTSDNPRSEPPMKIIGEIQKGFRSPAEVYIEPLRQAAIEKALRQARPGDIVVIAGKGHENYQIIGDEKIPFNDAEIVRNFLKD